MIDSLIAVAAITGTVGIYAAAVYIYKKFNSPFTIPVIIATVIIIAILLAFQIPYEIYMRGGEWIDHMLGPAIVALAYPVYQRRKILKKLLVPILSGTMLGAAVGVSTGVLLAKWSGVDQLIIHSLAPKSVTTPVAMAITDTLGGATPLAAVFVMIAGIGGVLISSTVMKCFRIHHPIGRGVGMGSASHAIGTATIMELDQLAGSVSTIAMVVSAVVVSVITPGLVAVLM
ncbi:TIGR00659 family protein [Virgibacillus subterraneus]|uniref:TIGR00659 family protein n=1 Tax=Virgibacillus subterraneus TaxID=621109 RepID=A0A1H8ZEY9_9BACI|nr:LrgB family protein [Virgibacillus subterraneus]SEP62278.1 TIGR00659 family protein [Virgibacillus subterraneus]